MSRQKPRAVPPAAASSPASAPAENQGLAQPPAPPPEQPPQAATDSPASAPAEDTALAAARAQPFHQADPAAAAALGVDLTAEAPARTGPAPRNVALMERYSALVTRMENALRRRFHPGKAEQTDMAAMELVAEAVERLAAADLMVADLHTMAGGEAEG